MSLILEALKKLEREKEAPDRGFLVLGHLPWATAPKRRLRAAAAVSLVAAVLAAAALALWRAGGERRQPLPAAAAIPASAPRPIAASARPKAAPAPSTSSPPPAEAVPAEFRLSAISQQDGVPVPSSTTAWSTRATRSTACASCASERPRWMWRSAVSGV